MTAIFAIFKIRYFLQSKSAETPVSKVWVEREQSMSDKRMKRDQCYA